MRISEIARCASLARSLLLVFYLGTGTGYRKNIPPYTSLPQVVLLELNMPGKTFAFTGGPAKSRCGRLCRRLSTSVCSTSVHCQFGADGRRPFLKNYSRTPTCRDESKKKWLSGVAKVRGPRDDPPDADRDLRVPLADVRPRAAARVDQLLRGLRQLPALFSGEERTPLLKSKV